MRFQLQPELYDGVGADHGNNTCHRHIRRTLSQKVAEIVDNQKRRFARYRQFSIEKKIRGIVPVGDNQIIVTGFQKFLYLFHCLR